MTKHLTVIISTSRYSKEKSFTTLKSKSKSTGFSQQVSYSQMTYSFFYLAIALFYDIYCNNIIIRTFLTIDSSINTLSDEGGEIETSKARDRFQTPSTTPYTKEQRLEKRNESKQRTVP